MLDFTVGGMLAVLQRWPKLHEKLPLDTVFNEDVAVLAAGMFMSMSKADMLEYWRRIFSNGFVPGYFRMAYCIDTEKVERSIAALEKFVHEVYGR